MKKIKHKLLSNDEETGMHNKKSNNYMLDFSTTKFIHDESKFHTPLPSIVFSINQKIFLFMPCYADRTDILFDGKRKFGAYSINMNLIYSVIEKSGKTWHKEK